MKIRALIVFCMVVVLLGVSNDAFASPLPSLNWQSDGGQASVTGNFILNAVGTPVGETTSSSLVKWCFTRNGAPLTGQQVAFSHSSASTGVYGYLNTSSDGCISSNENMLQVWLNSDSTKWENGSYIFAAQVTDSSGRTSTIATTTVSSNNSNPNVTWSSPTSTSSTVKGNFTLNAQGVPDPRGTAQINKWCFTRNGAPLTGQQVAFSHSSASTGVYGYLNTSSDGCISSNENMLQVWLNSDSTKWENGSYIFAAQVTDSSGRTSTIATTTATIENQIPTLGSLSFVQNNSMGSLTIDWVPGADGLVSVAGCKWTLDGSELSEDPCEQRFSEKQLSNIRQGHHEASVQLTFSNGHIVTKSITFNAMAAKMVLAATDLTLSCPSNLKSAGVACRVNLSVTNSATGTLTVTPKYDIGQGWVSLNKFRVTVGSSATFVLPDKMKSYEKVNVFASVSDGQISAQEVLYRKTVATLPPPGNRSSADYKSIYALMKRLASMNVTPFKKANTSRFGGTLGFCQYLEQAGENSANVTMASSFRRDYVAACYDYITKYVKN